MAGRQICAGYYRRYDGKVVYVVSLATDADTGEETVIWTVYPFTDIPRYYTSSKKYFCAFVEVNGERKARYKRLANMKISGEAVERLTEEGFRGPVRKRQRPQPDEAYDSREYQQADTYYAYAKDLCEHYNFDRNKYRLCVKEKRFAAITRSDFAKLKEDIQFLDNALNGAGYIPGLFPGAVRRRPVHPQVRRCPSTEPWQRGPPTKEIFFCPGSSAERAGRGRGNMPTAEINKKVNNTTSNGASATKQALRFSVKSMSNGYVFPNKE